MKATGDYPVLGLLCQVRKADDPSISVGTFKAMEGYTQTLACDGYADSGITHDGPINMTMTEFYWMPPMGDMGSLKVM